MIKPRWRKITGDLTQNKSRTLFVFFAMLIGLFGISVVADSYSILLREMNTNYMATTPASGTIFTDKPITTSEYNKLKELSYLSDVELREKVVGRIQVNQDEWKDIWLYVVKDFDNLKLNQFFPEEGNISPSTGEILLERKSLNLANAKLNDTLSIKIPNSNINSLALTGTVHAPGLAPSWMEGYAYGFITEDTLRLLGGTSKDNELLFLVNENQLSKKYITETTTKLISILEEDGYQVTKTEIPTPGKHIHFDQMATLLFLMEMFGFLALILSSILVANMITGILENQSRQIGVMKTLGAKTSTLFILYETMIFVLALASIIFALPLGLIVGRSYAKIAAEILNFNIYNNKVSFTVILFEIIIGCLVPIISAAFPIWRASIVSIKKSLTDYGISQDKYSNQTKSTFSGFTKMIFRPLLLSFRNTFRKKNRLIFTLLVMSIGGTGFITAMNIYSSMYNTVDKKVDSIFYDISVTFDQPHTIEELSAAFSEIDNLDQVEFWGGANVTRIKKDNTYSNSFRLIAPPNDTKLISTPPLVEGRWLNSTDTNAIVINQRLLSDEPDIKVGDTVTLLINGKSLDWVVVGISKELLGFPTAYCNEDYLAQSLKMENYAMNAIIVTNNHDIAFQDNVAKDIENTMPEKNLPIASLNKIKDTQLAIKNHLTLLASFLIMMSLLVVFVGGLGLATTLSLNTTERTKEIGIMRAIGATPFSISTIVITEGVLMGLISWIFALILSFPISQYISYKFGMIFFESPLEFAVSLPGFLIWLVIVIVFAALSSYYPSKKAISLSLKDALSYE